VDIEKRHTPPRGWVEEEVSGWYVLEKVLLGGELHLGRLIIEDVNMQQLLLRVNFGSDILRCHRIGIVTLSKCDSSPLRPIRIL